MMIILVCVLDMPLLFVSTVLFAAEIASLKPCSSQHFITPDQPAEKLAIYF